MTESDTPDDIIKPSQELLSEIEVFAEQYLNSKKVADRIIELAKQEGISNRQLRQLVEDSLRKRGLTQRTIYRALPDELKRTYSQSDNVSHVEEITTNKPEPYKTKLPENADPLLRINQAELHHEELIERHDELVEEIEVRKSATEAIQKLMSQNEQLKNENEDIKLKYGKIEEQMKEQSKYFHDTLKAINDNKNKTVLQSKEYLALQSEMYLIQEENTQLKQIETKRMKEHPEQTFQSASAVAAAAAAVTTTPTTPNNNEIKFPAAELITFFQMSKNAKKWMYLQIQDGIVKSWESDYTREREKKQSGGK